MFYAEYQVSPVVSDTCRKAKKIMCQTEKSLLVKFEE